MAARPRRRRPVAVRFPDGPPPAERTIDLPGGRVVHWAETGRTDGPLVLLVHGTPGDWQNFSDVMRRVELTDRALVVSVDRLGWAGSAAGGLEPSLERQAAAVAAVIRAHPGNRPVVVVGHSYGAPVAARTAVDHPDLVDGLVIASAAVDPASHGFPWYEDLAQRTAVRWAVPEILVDASAELAPFQRELELLLPRWAELRCPVTAVHGEDDRNESIANLDVVIGSVPAELLRVQRIPHLGHAMPWDRPDALAAAALEVLDRVPAR